MTTTADLFNAMDEKYGEARPDQGQGWLGTWPPEGDHECEIIRVEINEKDRLVESGEGGMRTEHPAVSYRFWFLLPENPEGGEPLEWGGNPFVFPKDPDAVKTEGIQTSIEINRNRFCGHLKCCLGVPVGNSEEDAIAVGNAVDKAIALINDGEQKLLADVRCQYREYTSKRGKKGVNRSEFLLSLLS